MDSAAMKYDYASLNSLLRDQVNVAHSRIHSLPLLGCKQPIRFLLMRPECGSICPITHEPIVTSTLNSEAIDFDPEHPDRKAIRLPCQHEFTATCLLFYWLRNDTVRCPMCRAEPPCTRLNVQALPSHLQLDIPDSVGSLSDGSDESSDSEPDEPVYSWSVDTKTFEEMFNNLHIEQFGPNAAGRPSGIPLFRPSGIPLFSPSAPNAAGRPSGIPLFSPSPPNAAARPSGIPLFSPSAPNAAVRPSGIPLFSPSAPNAAGSPSGIPLFRPSGIPLFSPSGTDNITALLQRPKPAQNFQFTA